MMVTSNDLPFPLRIHLLISHSAEALLILLIELCANQVCYASLMSSTVAPSEGSTLKNATQSLNSPYPLPIIIPPIKEHTATLIFLHGIGDSGQTWYDELAKLRQPYMKVLCPNAKMLPLTINDGINSTAWFDKIAVNSTVFDIRQLNLARAYVHRFIASEIKRNIRSNRIFIGGFGQGGSVALYAALTYPRMLGGIVVLSTWVPIMTVFQRSIHPVNKHIPILHSDNDIQPMEVYARSKQIQAFIDNFAKNHNVDVKLYSEADHALSRPERKNIVEFLKTHCRPLGRCDVLI